MAEVCSGLAMLSDAAAIAPLDAAGADIVGGLAEEMVRAGLVSVPAAARACAVWARRRTPDIDMKAATARFVRVLTGRDGMGDIYGAAAPQ